MPYEMLPEINIFYKKIYKFYPAAALLHLNLKLNISIVVRHLILTTHDSHKTRRNPKILILTWHGEDLDQEAGFSRSRLLHCTSVELKSAIIPNVGESSALFLLVGDCVRAILFMIKIKKGE